MNAQSSRTNSMLLGVTTSGLLLVAHAPQDASAFSAPLTNAIIRRPKGAIEATTLGAPANSRIEVGATRKPSRSRSSRTSQLELAGHLAYLDSLHSITANPDLFPTTSNYIRTLDGRGGNGVGGVAVASSASAEAAIPSPEEFLTQLSKELLKASKETEIAVQQEEIASNFPTSSSADAAPSSSVDEQQSSSFLQSLAETTLLPLTAGGAVYAAASSYDPSYYSSDRTQLIQNGAYGSYNNWYDGYATDHDSSNNALRDLTTVGESEFVGTPAADNSMESSSVAPAMVDDVADGVLNSAPVVSNDFAAATNNGGDVILPTTDSLAPAMSEESGSNALRDLVSAQAVPLDSTSDDAISQPAQAMTMDGGDVVASTASTDNILPAITEESGSNALRDLAASQGPPLDSSSDALSQTTQAASAMDSAANTIGDSIQASNSANAGQESFAAWHANAEGGSNALRDLASSITNIEHQDVGYLVSAQETGYRAQDYFGNAGYYYMNDNGESMQADHFFDASTMANAYASSSLELGGVTVDEVADAYSKLEEKLGEAVATIAPDNGLDSVSSSAQDYVAAVDITAPVRGTESLIPTVNIPDVASNDISNTLKSQLDSLPIGDSTDINTAAQSLPGKSPLLRDFIKDQIERLDLQDKIQHLELKDKIQHLELRDKIQHLELPNYHIELPEVLSTSLSTIKEATSSVPTEKLGGFFSSLGDKVDMADVSNSLEGLSSQFGKVASAMTSGASAAGEGLAGAGSAYVKSFSEDPPAKKIVNEIAGAASSVKPPPTLPGVSNVQPQVDLPRPTMSNVNIQSPKLPDMNLPHPTMPNVNLEMPAFPHVNIPTPHLPNVNIPGPVLPHVGVVEKTNVAMTSLREASLADFGDGVISAVKSTGGIILKFLDFILNAVAGTTFSAIFTNVYTSVTSVIDNAVHAVVSTITNIGNMSIIEIIQHLMALVIAITDILLKIMNAMVYIISGKDGAEWALQATTSVNDATSHLLAQTSSTYDHVTHASMAELTHTLGEYSQYVGNELLALVSSLNGVADGSISLDGVPLDPDMLDTVATAVQTAMTL